MKNLSSKNHKLDGLENLDKFSYAAFYDGFNGLPRARVKQTPVSTYDQPVKNKILSRVPAKLSEAVFAALKMVHLKAGETVYEAQENIRFLYFPETAVCAEFEILENGKMIELAMTGREGLTGISSFYGSHPLSKLTQVLQTGSAWRVDYKVFNSVIRDSAEMNELIGDYLKMFVNQISQKIVCQKFHHIEERLCTWLLMLLDRNGGVRLSLTHEEIALSLGANRPSISVITSVMREKEIIDYTRGKIFLRDRSKLEALACACYLTIN